MLATLVGEPFHKPGWVYEEKYDGYRILAYKEGDEGDAALAQRQRSHRDLRVGGRVRSRSWPTAMYSSMAKWSHSIAMGYRASSCCNAVT